METNYKNIYFEGCDAKVGGLYPDVPVDGDYLSDLLSLEGDKDLAGLTPSGFSKEASPFDPFSFELPKVLEIAETVVNYFVITKDRVNYATYHALHSLLQTLLSCPESNCEGTILPGELLLAMRLALVDCKLHSKDPEEWYFGLDMSQAYDANNYIDNEHGFENLLRPAPWFKREKAAK